VLFGYSHLTTRFPHSPQDDKRRASGKPSARRVAKEAIPIFEYDGFRRKRGQRRDQHIPGFRFDRYRLRIVNGRVGDELDRDLSYLHFFLPDKK
jgi:hypothetical protein